MTVAVAFVPSLDFAYRDPTLHVALETTAALTASAVAFLLLGRFRRAQVFDELVLAAGLAVLALSSLAFGALPAVVKLEPGRVSVWFPLAAGTIAAGLICWSALLSRRWSPAQPRLPFLVLGVALVVTAAATVPVMGSHELFHRITSSLPAAASRPSLVAHPLVLGVEILQALLYITAAVGFFRRNLLTDDELSGWLAIACVFGTTARASPLLYPSLSSGWVYTGDVFWLAFYLVLLAGAAREIVSYWTASVAAASLDERRRLASDMHDGLAQELAFIGRNARLLRPPDPDPDAVERIIDAVSRAQLESRRLVWTLKAKVDEPLEEALAKAAREAAARYGASVEMELAPGISLSPRQKEDVIRIASEAVTNAARHSGASRLQLELERRDRGLRLRVVDDGVGFDYEPGARHGFGLIGMRDRAEALGARLSIRSRRGRGTRVGLDL